MAHREQHVWNCDYCDKQERIEKDKSLHHDAIQAGIGRYKPKGWGSVSVSGLGEAVICPECLADVVACVTQLREG
jgi:hypothetical protein